MTYFQSLKSPFVILIRALKTTGARLCWRLHSSIQTRPFWRTRQRMDMKPGFVWTNSHLPWLAMLCCVLWKTNSALPGSTTPTMDSLPCNMSVWTSYTRKVLVYWTKALPVSRTVTIPVTMKPSKTIKSCFHLPILTIMTWRMCTPWLLNGPCIGL